ncbi:06f1a003-dff2-4b43-a961-2840998a1fbb [Sclerotinia trifoliorum]|uniref:06f1a003-dff2-4b43-a961-2840998a1fbb n=1 Tax=Sclerotinia trifoliorum TaxID=28548 RepID=A0A8H2VRC1_9HELO|nr:06f1a003-dff2-4b43-a961-2840998a1fbb [Sclerotinia trifoliorum]
MSTNSASRLAATKRAFHNIVQELFHKTQEPVRPRNYRGATFQQSEKYVLLHEEEQHLSDHIAVLTQAKGGPHDVSVATIEECHERYPPSLTIRIASNQTPSLKTVDGLRRCLDIVEEIAREETDQNEEEHRSKLLSEIVKLSNSRLRARIASQSKGHGKARQSLCDRAEKLRSMLLVQEMDVDSPQWRTSVCGHLANLIQDTKTFDSGSQCHQLDNLVKIVLTAHEVSTTGGSPSLEHQFYTKGIDPDIVHRSTVLQIDKISRYLDIRNDLMHYCQKQRCQGLFRNIQLEVCTAPEIQRVHGEIQLIFFYEQYPASLPPRCIGSSKSACFLCDLFIRKHGMYHISHSHGRLYVNWTIPEGDWMDEEKILRFDEILRDMNREMVQIKETFVKPIGYEGNGAESRVHLLTLPPNRVATSSDVREREAPKEQENGAEVEVI